MGKEVSLLTNLLALLLVGAMAGCSSTCCRWRTCREDSQLVVARVAGRLELDEGLLLAVAAVESGFDADARSDRGAIGLLQVMPETGREVAEGLGYRTWDLTDPQTNAFIGGTYLKGLLRRYRDDLHLALGAYHAGPGRMDEWIGRGQGLPGPEVIEQFAFPVTRQYVSRVLQERARIEYSRSL